MFYVFLSSYCTETLVKVWENSKKLCIVDEGTAQVNYATIAQ